jgi:hypothetical protein
MENRYRNKGRNKTRGKIKDRYRKKKIYIEKEK